MLSMSHLFQASITTLQAHQTDRGGLDGHWPSKIRIIVAYKCVHAITCAYRSGSLLTYCIYPVPVIVILRTHIKVLLCILLGGKKFIKYDQICEIRSLDSRSGSVQTGFSAGPAQGEPQTGPHPKIMILLDWTPNQSGPGVWFSLVWVRTPFGTGLRHR